MDAVLAGRELSVAYQQNMIIPPMDVKLKRMHYIHYRPKRLRKIHAS